MTLAPSTTATGALVRPRAARVLAALAGAALVALAAQISVPLPGTLVPMSLQPLAVLLVGGLLGPALGAASLTSYLVLGAVGLPVFALGRGGAVWLFGPDGGYLLAFPAAAALVGWVVARRPGWAGLVAGPLLGMLTIYAGGLAQLTVLSGSPRAALLLGALPFVFGDLVKIAAAALLLRGARPLTRALR
jgi:biotin transport system substrate-specific component